jgi:hypothetical protein
MIILLSSLSSANLGLSLEYALEITGSVDDSIENTDYFCRFLLQTWRVKVGEKATSGWRFNTRPLVESQNGDDIRTTGRLSAPPLPERRT